MTELEQGIFAAVDKGWIVRTIFEEIKCVKKWSPWDLSLLSETHKNQPAAWERSETVQMIQNITKKKNVQTRGSKFRCFIDVCPTSHLLVQNSRWCFSLSLSFVDIERHSPHIMRCDGKFLFVCIQESESIFCFANEVVLCPFTLLHFHVDVLNFEPFSPILSQFCQTIAQHWAEGLLSAKQLLSQICLVLSRALLSAKQFSRLCSVLSKALLNAQQVSRLCLAVKFQFYGLKNFVVTLENFMVMSEFWILIKKCMVTSEMIMDSPKKILVAWKKHLNFFFLMWANVFFKWSHDFSGSWSISV